MKHVSELGAQYEREGYVTALSVLSEAELSALRAGYDACVTEIGMEAAQYSLHNVHLQQAWVMEAAANPRVVSVMRDLLGPDVVLLDSRFICKFPVAQVAGEGKPAPYVAWHQDIRYWGLDGGPVASMWLALDDVDAENGVLTVIPGSHKQGVLEHRVAQAPGNLLTANQEIPENLVDTTLAVQCPLRAGQMSVHDGLTVHASDPNFSQRRRCGLVVRYVPTCAHPSDDPDRPRKFPATVLISGQDKFGHFEDHAPAFFNKVF
ncbi:putative alpha-ketoglutarate-dependent hypophosphite dioxygenase [Petromyzon marinus]|uniref:Probable alpha-ketoglutarate-dependent hypophosphite dioxygenase n=1 Tax=Petromyzon marinus TaxID=7757 RepID=A0AAJ7WWD4_PETMA|nr:probable alpha-ketoglutarate-dependent hypophosphite dioxygenase [Petromyzon marinus]